MVLSQSQSASLFLINQLLNIYVSFGGLGESSKTWNTVESILKMFILFSMRKIFETKGSITQNYYVINYWGINYIFQKPQFNNLILIKLSQEKCFFSLIFFVHFLFFFTWFCFSIPDFSCCFTNLIIFIFCNFEWKKYCKWKL